MDSGSSAERYLSDPTGSLNALAESRGTSFENLRAARVRTAEKISALTEQIGPLRAPKYQSLAMFGSWARGELTRGSDNDWAIVTRGIHPLKRPVKMNLKTCRKTLNKKGRNPGAQDIFGCAFASEELTEFIGLDSDSNTNLTRRMLLLVESVSIAGDCHERSRTDVLRAYLDHGVKVGHPPRFLLNDLVRYWRTICVDFEGKHRGEGAKRDKWVMRNAKLRTARKMLFVGSLVPLLLCSAVESVDEVQPFLQAQFRAMPSDRLAAAFLWAGAQDEGVRTLEAYDRWIGLIGQKPVRKELKNLTEDDRYESERFLEVCEIGRELDRGFRALLFETQLREVTQKFAVL